MEGNEIEKAAEAIVADDMEIAGEEEWIWIKGFKAGAKWKTERENAELTRALARIDELTTQNLDLIRKYDDLYRKANGV